MAVKSKRRDPRGQLLLDFGTAPEPVTVTELPSPDAAASSALVNQPQPAPAPHVEPMFANLISTLKRIGPETPAQPANAPEPPPSTAAVPGDFLLRTHPEHEPVPPAIPDPNPNPNPEPAERLTADDACDELETSEREDFDELETLAQSEASAAQYAAGLHFVTEARAIELFAEVGEVLRPNQIKAVRVRFFPFRATLYSFKLDRSRRANIKMHVAFRRASEAVLKQAAGLMLCRVRAERAKLPRKEYDNFVRAIPVTDFKLPGARKATRMALGSQGVHRHLEDSFKRVNETYFRSQLKQPELCWSPVKARRLLGSYHERNDRLIISRVFDSPNVPIYVLDFLMYHELLHKFLGIGRRDDGRRDIHSPDFKKLERRYPQYHEAQEYLKRL